MTAKEKAEQLFDAMYDNVFMTGGGSYRLRAKQCALIAVEEILNSVKFNSDLQPVFWNDVKREIEKL